MNCTTLIADDECCLVWVQTHALHRSIDLEQTLALLRTSPEMEVCVSLCACGCVGGDLTLIAVCLERK